MRRFQETPGWSPGRLNYVVHHTVIMAECLVCGEMREFDRDAVPPVLKHSLISEIEPRLKCSACGKRAAKLRFGNWVDGGP